MTSDPVYHGSKEYFDIAIPKRQRRGKLNSDKNLIPIFDEISFHATPHRWIALAYICDQKKYEIDGKIAHYIMGVDLYEHRKELEILGFESLEKSLEALFGDGGWLMSFDKNKFCHMEGLGNLEVICKGEIKPEKIERIDDPVAELKKRGDFPIHRPSQTKKCAFEELYKIKNPARIKFGFTFK